jgi:glycerol-3-phosphate acyltransferase PlsY
MIALLIKYLAAYLLGSVSGSIVLGKLRHVDIRESGSGNAGGTNAFRTQGFLFALGVVIIDIGKGALAAAWVSGWHFSGLPDVVSAETSMLACGFAAVLGHCYPLYHGFRGGKGAGTAVGAILVIQPWLLLPLLLTWVVVLGLTGMVGLSTMLAGISLIPGVLWMGGSPGLLIFAIALAVFLVFTHRSNIANMRAGSEYRFERARFRNWFG